MRIRNRIADIKALQVHILQEYFRMELSVNFSGDEWKAPFRDVVKSGLDSKYSHSYVGAWDKIQIKGLSNYSVDDMDTTIITAILKGRSSFDCCKSIKINQSLENLQDDRNIDAHTTGNETDSELLQWAYGSLHNLSKFISDIDKSAHAPDADRHSFARKYKDKIVTLRKNFENDYKEILKYEEIETAIERDISLICTSKEPDKIWLDIVKKYLVSKDYVLFYEFLHAAANKDIIWAYSYLGDRYFDGLMIDKDYKKAADYYSKGFERLTPAQKLNLAGIYINRLNSSHSAEEGTNILKSCESPRWQIVSYTTNEGYEFYKISHGIVASPDK